LVLGLLHAAWPDVAAALVALDCADVKYFLAAMHCVQHEPGWEGATDSAIHVRTSCAMGLVATGYSRAIAELTVLLADPEWRVRAGAVRAISRGRPDEAEVVLRLKVLTGDAEAEVIGECFTGLLGVACEECVPFVAKQLTGGRDSLRDYAALALGESRHPAALARLREAWEACPPVGGLRAQC
jgi:HEAT repeat protein